MMSVSEHFKIPKPKREDVEDILNDLDQDSDKKLSFEEMKEMI